MEGDCSRTKVKPRTKVEQLSIAKRHTFQNYIPTVRWRDKTKTEAKNHLNTTLQQEASQRPLVSRYGSLHTWQLSIERGLLGIAKSAQVLLKHAVSTSYGMALKGFLTWQTASRLLASWNRWTFTISRTLQRQNTRQVRTHIDEYQQMSKCELSAT